VEEDRLNVNAPERRLPGASLTVDVL